jgi:hypothetical protein
MYTSKTNNRRKTSRINKKLVLLALAVLLAIGGAIAYKQTKDQPANQTPETTPSGNANLSPPTPQEQQETNQHKQGLADQPPPATTPTGGPKKVTPVITGSQQEGAQYIIGAYVSGIYESGGVCTLTATQGSLTVTKQTDAEKDATTTRCNNFVFNRSDFPSSGTWTLTVKYTSGAASGTSQPATLEIK